MFIYILGFALEWAIELSDAKVVESGARRAKVPLLNGTYKWEHLMHHIKYLVNFPSYFQ